NDNLSLLTCVDSRQPATLLHPLPTRDGRHIPVQVRAAAPRHFVLDPYPYAEPSLTFQFPARHVQGKIFSEAAESRMPAPETRIRSPSSAGLPQFVMRMIWTLCNPT